jgi:tRNA(Ile)-lysidine synthase
VARRPPAVARVLERVTQTAREFKMFEPGDLVLVSVSGGPDSVCLLYSLWHLRRLFRIRLAVFHFDHRLRPKSADDARYVERLTDRLKLSFHLRTAEEQPSKGASVEAWATVARRNAAVAVRNEVEARVVAEGHTLDDQVETVLLNLVRGTGLEGLSGIDPGGGGSRLAQPLFEVERSDVEAFCRALHLRPRRDPMNEDPRYLRAAIRHDVLPLMARATGRGVSEPIARTASLVRRDLDALNAETVERWREIVTGPRGEIASGPNGDLAFAAGALADLPTAIASRVVRFAMYNAMSGDESAPWSREAIEAVLDLARGRPGRRRSLADGLLAVRDREYVRVSRPSPRPDGIDPNKGEGA